jgi:hypothetical protein
MERTYPGIELIETINNCFSALLRDYGHRDEGYCLACDNEPFEAIESLKDILSERPNWPEDIHKQYLSVLDERDNLQEKIDQIESIIGD